MYAHAAARRNFASVAGLRPRTADVRQWRMAMERRFCKHYEGSRVRALVHRLRGKRRVAS
jgi:hypothetical protein